MYVAKDKGSAAVEFALIIPVLILVLFGIIQYGLIFSTHITVRNATVVGARVAAMYSPTTNPITNGQNAAQTAIQRAALNTANIQSNTCVSGSPGYTCSLSYRLKLLLPFIIPGNAGGNMNISASTYME